MKYRVTLFDRVCYSAGIVCGAGMFKCHDDSCIPLQWICDAEPDCGDGSDESNSSCASK